MGSIVTGFSNGTSLRACHAHELRHPVHFGGARPAFACLAVPSAGEIRRLRPLDLVHSIEHDHAFRYFGRIIAKFTTLCVAAPDFENGRFHCES